MMKLIQTIVLLSWFFSACGQERVPLTLQSALELAKNNYPMIKAKESEVSAQERKLSASKTEYLPALLVGGQINYATTNSITGAYISNDGLSTSISGGVRDHNIYTAVFGSFGTLEVDWKIFNFGKVAANVNVARAALEYSHADYENELFQHRVRVADAYLLALVLKKITLAQQNNLARAHRLLDVILANTASGLKAGADSSFALAEASKAKIQFLESKKNEQAQLIKLSELIGEKQDIVEVDTAGFFTQVPADFSTDTIQLGRIPQLQYVRAQVDARRARSISIRRSYLPSLLLTGTGFARGSGVSNQNDSFNKSFSSGVNFQAYNYYAGISLRMNILNYSRVHNEYRSEQFEIDRAQHEYDDAELKVFKQLELAEMQLTLARQQAAESPIQYSAALASYRQSNARYRAGLSTIADLAQNFYLLNRAEVDKSIAINNVWRAILLKAAASGNLSFLMSQVN